MDLLGASHWLGQTSAGEVVDPDAAVVGDAVVGATVVGAMSNKKTFQKELPIILTVSKGNL